MSGTELVSIIIPVFNGEKHLRQCLDSVSAQSHRDLEIIVVDDGSTDGTPEILRTAAHREPRMTVVRRPNGGVSAARNAGLDVATGAWVMFVDADDMLCDPLVVEVVVLAGRTGAELIRFGSSSRAPRPAGTTTSSPGRPGSGDRTPARGPAELAARADDAVLGEAALAELIAGEQLNALWDKAYRRETILERGCRFREGTRMGEDLLFNLAYIRVGSAVRTLPVTGYFYRRDNTESATRRYLPGKYGDLMDVNDEVRRWASRLGAAELTGAAEFIRAKNVVSCIRDLHHTDCTLSSRERVAVARRYKAGAPSVRPRGVGLRRRVFGELYSRLGPRSVFHLSRLLVRSR